MWQGRREQDEINQSDAPFSLATTMATLRGQNIPLKLDQWQFLPHRTRQFGPMVWRLACAVHTDADATAAMTPLPAAAIALRKLNNHAEGTNRKHFVLHPQRQHAVGHRCSSRALRPRQQTKDSPPPRPGHQYPPCFPPLGASSSHQFPPSTVISLYPEPRYYSRNTMSGKTSL
jgi:hypothetical protein